MTFTVMFKIFVVRTKKKHFDWVIRRPIMIFCPQTWAESSADFCRIAKHLWFIKIYFPQPHSYLSNIVANLIMLSSTNKCTGHSAPVDTFYHILPYFYPFCMILHKICTNNIKVSRFISLSQSSMSTNKKYSM